MAGLESRAGSVAPGSPEPTRSMPVFQSSVTAANREPRQEGPATGAAPIDRPESATRPGACPGGEPTGGLSDVRLHRTGAVRRQSQATPNPVADLLPGPV